MSVDEHASQGMVNSIMYKSCFYEQERHTVNGVVGGHPEMRKPVYSALKGGVKFEHLEEAYSPTYRTVRLYKLRPRSEFYISRNRAFVNL